MARFNVKKNGYKFDKVIFWSSTAIILIILVGLFVQHGFSYKPYILCKGSVGVLGVPDGYCKNPFYDEHDYTCTHLFGLWDCDIEEYDWMKEEYLPVGEYGEKPIDMGKFGWTIFSAYLLAFALNHLIWNRSVKIDFKELIKKANEADDESDND